MIIELINIFINLLDKTKIIFTYKNDYLFTKYRFFITFKVIITTIILIKNYFIMIYNDNYKSFTVYSIYTLKK